MSGQPHPTGVRELSAWLRKLDEASEQVACTEAKIKENQQYLETVRTDAQVAKENVERLMAKMDVHAPGNFGYEGRMLWLLRELNKQAEQYGRQYP